MPAINDTFVNALLADASYVDFLTPGLTDVGLALTLAPRMTPTLAEFIGVNFTVVSAINTPDDVINGAGFDGVIWKGNAGTPYAGKTYVSMRGTEGVADFVTDANLALLGDAAQQTADMVNWWLRETTPAGQTAPQFAWRLLSGTFENIARAAGTGRISASDLAAGVYVNGHSLGGFLAATFTRLFGTQANVLQTSTFNSAGFAIGSEPVLAALQNLVGSQLGRPSFPGSNNASQLNYFATHGLNLTTNTWWFSQVGQRIELFNEESGSQIPNHFMYKLTDALALANAMSKLDSSMTLARANAAFETGSVAIAADLEGTLDGLRRLLLGPTITMTPAADVSDSAGTRVQFHANLDALVTSGAFASLVGKVRIDVASGQIRGKARSDFSAMATLLSLSPVVLTGTDSANAAQLQSALQGAWGQSFNDWQADNNLSQADRAAGKQSFSDNWIDDRARLLNAVNLQNQRNSSTGQALDTTVPSDRIYEFQYYGGDLRPGELLPPLRTLIATSRPGAVLPPQFIAFGDGADNTLDGTANQRGDHLYGGAGADSLNGLGGNDWLEGNQGNDTLNGGDGADTLLGGTGIDTLDGGLGNDILLGGIGTDTYNFSGSFGADVAEDSGGAGSIVISGLPALNGADAPRRDATTWRTDDGQVTYTLVDLGTAAAPRQNLVITVAAGAHAGTITIRNWSEGQLGINLGAEVLAPATTNTYAGDYAKATNAAGDLYLLGPDGNYLADGAQADAPDVLNGSAAADWLQGSGGNDGLAGGAADDLIEGGAGDDLLLGGWGTDVLNGGAGNDFLFGSALGSIARPTAVDFSAPELPAGTVELARGFSWMAFRYPGDRIVGDTAVFRTPQVAGASLFPAVFENGQYLVEASGNLIDGGAGDDYISAGTGADIVHGGDADDDIVGMDGADVLFGDAGDDFIQGDGSSDASRASSDHSYVPASLHGNDLLVGGAGNDVLAGQGGDDELYGGTEDDWLWGDDDGFLLSDTPAAIHGNDYLDGGDGVDRVEGGGGGDLVFGGSGNDRLWGDDSRGLLPVEYHGVDYLDGEDGDDQMVGGGHDDVLIGGTGSDLMWGDDVQSRVAVSAHGADWLDGGEGNDRMTGGAGDDEMLGGAGNDQLLGDDIGSNVAISAHGMDFLDGGAGNDTLIGGGNGDNLFGGDGDDFLCGDDVEANVAASAHGADWLEGGAGDDTLYGDGGNDTLNGGTGVDYLDGGTGDDIYHFDVGDSSNAGSVLESVTEANGSNTIVFGAGIGLDQLQVASVNSGQWLRVDYASQDSLLVASGVGGSVQTYRFADGTSLSYSDLIGQLSTAPLAGRTAGGLYTVMGGRNNDAIGSSEGFATLSGGRGDDTFNASGGGNSYLYSRGDGLDTITDLGGTDPVSGAPLPRSRIVFGAGIAPSDVTLTADGSLVLRVGPNAGDAIRITGFDANDALATPSVDRFVFADGTVLTHAQLLARGFDFAGTAGDETLLGTSVVDRFAASAGNDTLSGGAGGDVYHLTTASGQAVIIDGTQSPIDQDTLRVGSGLAPTDLVYQRSGNDLVVRDQLGTNRVLVTGHYSGTGIERIEFFDGTAWTAGDIDAHLTNELSEGADIFTGSAGDDIISVAPPRFARPATHETGV